MKLPGLNHGNERHPTTHALFGSARLHAWGARDAGWHLIIEDIPSVTKIRHVRNKRIVIARIVGFVLLAGARGLFAYSVHVLGGLGAVFSQAIGQVLHTCQAPAR